MAVSAQVLVASLRRLPLPIRQNPYKTAGCCLPVGAMTESSEDHSTFPLRKLLLGDETHGKTSELHWKFRSPWSHFMSHTLTPAQRDTIVMDKGEIVPAVKACWKRSHVMNVLVWPPVFLKERCHIRSSAGDTGFDTRHKYLHTLCSFIEVDTCTSSQTSLSPILVM